MPTKYYTDLPISFDICKNRSKQDIKYSSYRFILKRQDLFFPLQINAKKNFGLPISLFFILNWNCLWMYHFYEFQENVLKLNISPEFSNLFFSITFYLNNICKILFQDKQMFAHYFSICCWDKIIEITNIQINAILNISEVFR